MRYLPKSPADREEMLAEIGVKSIDTLFESIPAEYRLTTDLNVPRQHGESEIIERFRDSIRSRRLSSAFAGSRRTMRRAMRAFWAPACIGTTSR